MKQFLLSILVISLFAVSCKKNAQKGGEEKEIAAQTESAAVYTVDSASSVINWQGFKINQSSKEESGHHGTIRFASADSEFTVQNDTLVSGSFIANMQSMAVTDMADDKEAQSKLVVHLKADDFFGTDQFPIAKFELTKVTPLAEGDFNTELEGNLTIRDKTKNYTLKANTSSSEDSYTIHTDDFIFDRQEFGVVYPGMGENIVNDDVKLQIQIVGKRK